MTAFARVGLRLLAFARVYLHFGSLLREPEICVCLRLRAFVCVANTPFYYTPFLGVSQRPLTLILPQKYRDTNGRRIVIQIGCVYTTFCHREGIHLQKYAIEMGGVSRYFFTCIGVRGRFDSPDFCGTLTQRIWGKFGAKTRGKIRDENPKSSGNIRSATFLT